MERPEPNNSLAGEAGARSQVEAQCPTDASQLGRAEQCKGCPGREMCQAAGANGPDPDQPSIDVRMGAIKHRVLVLSGKGGVGKSSLTAMLGMALAGRGLKVSGLGRWCIALLKIKRPTWSNGSPTLGLAFDLRAAPT